MLGPTFFTRASKPSISRSPERKEGGGGRQELSLVYLIILRKVTIYGIHYLKQLANGD
jgi:hypothetical protein